MSVTVLVCIACGLEEGSMETDRFRCKCGGLFDIRRQQAEGVDADMLKWLFDERLLKRTGLYASGVWRYKELIAPDIPDARIVTRGEGNTGLYESESLAARAGVRRLSFKAQSENPSGSFKDNGMTAAVSHGRALGRTRFACTSTGNTSSSLAMYAAWAGCASYILLPETGVAANKMLQTLAYGARVLEVPGGYDDGIRFLEDYAQQFGLYIGNSINPWRIEGQKSIVFELAHQLNWELPDWIVLPGGALSNATAAGKALAELKEYGFIKKVPRLAIVQAEGASPFHRMVESGDCVLTADPNASTRASALNIGSPPSWQKALDYAIHGTNGVTVAVTDAELFEEKAAIDRSGIGCEPASAATLAGLRRLVERGVVHPEETAVCLLTGHLLKDTDALADYHLEGDFGGALRNVPQSVRLTPDAMEAIIRSKAEPK